MESSPPPSSPPSLRWTQLSLQAASQLRNGNFDRAETLFSQALAGLEQSLPELQDALTGKNKNENKGQPTLSVSEFYQQEVQSLDQQEQQQSPSFDLDFGTKAYLVKVPLPSHLQDQQDQLLTVRVYQKLFLPSEDTKSNVFWFTALLYNMGLVHHLRGIHLGKDSALNHALQMYETAMGFQDEFFPRGQLTQQQQQQSCYQQPKGTMRVLLELAMSNNCAHIHSTFMDPLSVEDYITDMGINLSLLQPGLGIQPQDYRFFIVNGRNARFMEQQPAPQA